jgi:serine/threonine kinase 38
MKKEMMILKNQVGHVRAEREALAKATTDNRWLTALYYSFVDETHLYMVMEYCPGGDLMSLLIKEDTFSENVTKFFMAEAAHAISSVHALGYIHRDIKPDKYVGINLTEKNYHGHCMKPGEMTKSDTRYGNSHLFHLFTSLSLSMLLDARGHLKLTDLGLCKKVGEVSPLDDPDFVLKSLKEQGLLGDDDKMTDADGSGGSNSDGQAGASTGGGKHRSPDDAMAMSIDDGITANSQMQAGRQANMPTGKARREVRNSMQRPCRTLR